MKLPLILPLPRSMAFWKNIFQWIEYLCFSMSFHRQVDTIYNQKRGLALHLQKKVMFGGDLVQVIEIEPFQELRTCLQRGGQAPIGFLLENFQIFYSSSEHSQIQLSKTFLLDWGCFSSLPSCTLSSNGPSQWKEAPPAPVAGPGKLPLLRHSLFHPNTHAHLHLSLGGEKHSADSKIPCWYKVLWMIL